MVTVRCGAAAGWWLVRWVAVAAAAGALLGGCAAGAEGSGVGGPGAGGSGFEGTGSVIFVHPDGASAATWAAGRAYLVGPDGDLEWDKLPAVGVYRGHMRDSLTATSNGGATTHAYGVKVLSDAYGMSGGGDEAERIVDRAGRSLSIADQAMRAGMDVALVQSGTITEPGTGCFLAEVESRGMHEAIAAQLVESGAAVILGGGERWFLPAGEAGVHGTGVRGDDRDLVREARAAGYEVVYTRDELMDLPPGTAKVLGLFADVHTFNAEPEEQLREGGLAAYNEGAPTVGEMTEAALGVLRSRGRRFLLLVEEEGTDNFGNNNNAGGMMEAMRRADAALGVCRRYVRANPRTLLITAADSDGGGMRMLGIRDGEEVEALPASSGNGSAMDGVGGTGTAPFVSQPDRFGERHRFGIVWSAFADVSGGILVRGEGLNSGMITPSMDNTDVTRVMRATLFGE